jgi:hypothetical protein
MQRTTRLPSWATHSWLSCLFHGQLFGSFCLWGDSFSPSGSYITRQHLSHIKTRGCMSHRRQDVVTKSSVDYDSSKTASLISQRHCFRERNRWRRYHCISCHLLLSLVSVWPNLEYTITIYNYNIADSIIWQTCLPNLWPFVAHRLINCILTVDTDSPKISWYLTRLDGPPN